jgi:DNA-directed RNA polymerase specialized sigma24 family protein
MLGTIADAEDMLQETFIRWHQSAEQNIQSPRAFLVTIISRLYMNHLQSARVQREEYFGEWLPEPLLTDPNNDPLKALKIDESLSMAFLVLLERLTPIQRAVFLLHEVFSYKHTEIAVQDRMRPRANNSRRSATLLLTDDCCHKPPSSPVYSHDETTDTWRDRRHRASSRRPGG